MNKILPNHYDLGNRLRIVNIVLQNINRHYFKKVISMIDYFPLDYSLVSLIRLAPIVGVFRELSSLLVGIFSNMIDSDS